MDQAGKGCGGVVIPLSVMCPFSALYYFHRIDSTSCMFAFLFSDLLFSILHGSINLIVSGFSQTFVPNSARVRGSFQTKLCPRTFLSKQNFFSPPPRHCSIFPGAFRS